LRLGNDFCAIRRIPAFLPRAKIADRNEAPRRQILVVPERVRRKPTVGA
jgi:hypothetical protein